MCLVSSIVVVIGLATAGLIPWALYGQVWFPWWLGDVAGVLTLTPVLLTLFVRSERKRKPRSLVESALLFTALVAVGQLTFEY